MTHSAPSSKKPRKRRKQYSCGPANLQPGERRLVEVDGKQVGIFNVNGEYYALHNRCPHMGGNLCAGPVTGTTVPAGPYKFVYARDKEILRCAWHGWEFEIATGICLIDSRIRARTYVVEVKNGHLYLYI